MLNPRTRALLLMLLVSGLLAAALHFGGLLAPFERAALDLQHRAHLVEGEPDPRILIIAVDQRSIDHFDQDGIPFPWPRSLYNPVIDFASRHGAKAILFDILFNNESPFGPEVDQEFAGAIARSGRVYLAAAFSKTNAGQGAVDPLPGVAASGDSPPEIRQDSISPPLPALYQAAAGIGFVNQRPDADGIYRQAQPAIEYQGRAVGSLGMAPLLLANGGARWPTGLTGRELPVNEDYQLPLRFRQATPFRRLSAVDVMQAAILEQQGKAPSIDPALFRDSYVFVAYTAPGLFDLKPTPVQELSPGVMIHARMLANALDGDFMSPVNPWLEWLSGGVATLVLIGVTLGVQRLWLSSLASLLAMVLLVGLTQWGFHQGQVWNLPLLLLWMLTGLLLAGGYRYQVEGRQRRFLQQAFSHYVSPQVVARIAASPQSLDLGGEKREITVLFSDLAGFTSLAEQLDPHELVGVLNEYTTLMADTITQFEGTVDKFIGDAVMAFWGAPLDQPRQSELAITAALACLGRFEAFARRHFDHVPLAVRIGLDRGPCIVGNMGSRSRFDYTAIGDTVNQASRLEGLNKAYGTRILVGENAWLPVQGLFLGRQIDFLRVKGKQQPTRVYEAITASDQASPEQRQAYEDYQRAFDAYQSQDWDQAERILTGAPQSSLDEAGLMLLNRVRAYRGSPPGADWDGAYTHTNK